MDERESSLSWCHRRGPLPFHLPTFTAWSHLPDQRAPDLIRAPKDLRRSCRSFVNSFRCYIRFSHLLTQVQSNHTARAVLGWRGGFAALKHCRPVIPGDCGFFLFNSPSSLMRASTDSSCGSTLAMILTVTFIASSLVTPGHADEGSKRILLPKRRV